MRHNQNGRRFRGRNNGNNGNSSNNGNNGNHRRSNPKTQTFDSNGPEVRIRGNASQICEKYQILAKDARGAGDRVLAESYLQHAEHYQRLINEMLESQERINEKRRVEQEARHGDSNNSDHDIDDNNNDDNDGDGNGDGDDHNLDDLDQGFLVGDRTDSGEEEGAGTTVAKNKTVTARTRKPSRKTAQPSQEVEAV